MDETVRNVAWSIAEAWWRKNHRTGGAVPEAGSSKDYADNFWQSWCDEANAAVACMAKPKEVKSPSMGSAFLAPMG